MSLSHIEKAEFNQLKRDLLEYHELGCTHYNTKKIRYNELFDKLAKNFFKVMLPYKQMEEN